jgi:20S proteasome subunit beta 1
VPGTKDGDDLVGEFMQLNYHNKQLVAASILAGWDEEEGGQVYAIPIGGTLVREPWTTDGSGSTYIWGFMDSEYRSDFTKEEAQDFVKHAIALAMCRDGSSGGVIRLHTVDSSGHTYQFLQGKDIPVFGEDLPFMPAQQQGGIVVG